MADTVEGPEGPDPPLRPELFFTGIKHFICFETEILTTEGLHTTMNWLIFKNDTCVELRRSTK